MNTDIRSNLREYKFKSIYFKLLSLFICLIFIPSILIGTFIYFEASKKFESEINKYNLYTLEYIQGEIDNIVDNVNNVSVQYTMNGEVRYFNYEPFDSDRLALERISRMIGNTCLSYSYIDSMYVYYKTHNEIVTNNGVYNFKDFYDQDWAKGLNEIKDKKEILPTRNISYKLGNSNSNNDVITYIVPFPLVSTEKTGAVVINISVSNLISRLSSVKKDPESTIFMVDSEGKILLSDKTEYIYRNLADMSNSKNDIFGSKKLFTGQFKGEKMLFSNVVSNSMGWKFIEITPFKSVKDNVTFIRNIIFILLLLSLIFLVTVILITNKVYNPLTGLMEIVRNEELSGTGSRNLLVAKNELDMLKMNMKDISFSALQEREQNKILKSQVNHTKNILSKNLFKDLVLLSGEETEWVIKRLESLEWSLKSYVVLLISIDNYPDFQNKFKKKDQALWKYCVINIAEEIINLNYKGCIFEDSFNQWIVILNLPGCTEDEAYNITWDLVDKVREAINSYVKVFTVTTSIGSFSEDISQLSESFENAIKVSRKKWLEGKDQIFTYKDMDHENCDLYYNIEAEKNILYMLLYKNDLQEVNKCLESFFKELLIKNKNVYDNVYQGVLQLLLSVIRTMNEKGMALEEIFKADSTSVNYNIIKDFRKQETLKDTEIWLKELFRKISDYLWEQRNDSNDDNLSFVLDYISKNYNLDISLSVVAEKFGYSGSQLSKLFKKATGENFIDYISRFRVDKSKKLMTESENSIYEIARQVGYTNVQTYIRVFKKLEGTTPGQFKEDVKLIKDINKK